MKNDLNRDFYCFDWDEENPFVIYGVYGDDEFERIEMML